jgi:hypothetical protein
MGTAMYLYILQVVAITALAMRDHERLKKYSDLWRQPVRDKQDLTPCTVIKIKIKYVQI